VLDPSVQVPALQGMICEHQENDWNAEFASLFRHGLQVRAIVVFIHPRANRIQAHEGRWCGRHEVQLACGEARAAKQMECFETAGHVVSCHARSLELATERLRAVFLAGRYVSPVVVVERDDHEVRAQLGDVSPEDHEALIRGVATHAEVDRVHVRERLVDHFGKRRLRRHAEAEGRRVSDEQHLLVIARGHLLRVDTLEAGCIEGAIAAGGPALEARLALPAHDRRPDEPVDLFLRPLVLGVGLLQGADDAGSALENEQQTESNQKTDGQILGGCHARTGSVFIGVVARY
jgi:hypothetical protein